MKHDKKYNTPGLRRGKIIKEDFASFKKAVDRHRPDKDREGHRLAREPKEEDPVWAKRAFLTLGIPAALIAFGTIAWLLMLNVGNFSVFVTKDANAGRIPNAQVEQLPPLERKVYLGRQANGRTEYKLAWQYFRQVLAESPANNDANIGMLIALEGLLLQDDGWKPILEEHKKAMRDLGGEQ